MKAFVTIICMLFASLNVRAQSDSARIDSIIHTPVSYTHLTLPTNSRV